ncbi:hypothetical protein NA57DRAFT_70223 [Rhizodiscina lignyota]|uniref:Uncharacterized protein n=1 Tax=Rhizodiscina lignyota TaxID=1504668 RepID=A0A9P4ITJ0_9PEZI|nr:hypothetical protein NA57DRAFT_70223 [Rhizodiscina lignyota]
MTEHPGTTQLSVVPSADEILAESLRQLCIEDVTEAKSVFRFLDLPLELRNEIYEDLLLHYRPGLMHAYHENETFWKTPSELWPDYQKEELRPLLDEIMGVSWSKSYFPSAIFEVNKQIRQESLHIVHSAKLTWIIVHTDMPDYARKLSSAGFPVALASQIHKIRHPIMTVKLAFNRNRPGLAYLQDPFAVHIRDAHNVFRALNLTESKGRCYITARFWEVPESTELSQAQSVIQNMVESLALCRGVRKLIFEGVNELPKRLDVGGDVGQTWGMKIADIRWRARRNRKLREFVCPFQGYRTAGADACKVQDWTAARGIYICAILKARDVMMRYDDPRSVLSMPEDLPILVCLFMSNLGFCSYKLGMYRAALHQLNLVMECTGGPGYWLTEAFYRRALVYNALGKYADALLDLVRALCRLLGDSTILKEISNPKNMLAEVAGAEEEAAAV